MATYKLITDRLNSYFTNNKITVGTAAPTSGTHAAGDIVLSSSANSTAFGWICTAAGTPGTWKVLKSGGDVTSVSGNAGTATKLATARNITIGDKTNSFNGSAAISYTLSDIGAARGDNISATTAATAGWYRIAQSAVDQTNNIGLFLIRANVGSYHGSTIITAGVTYGKNPTLNQLAHTNYGSGVTQARIVYHTTYSGTYAYLEVYLAQAKATTITVDLLGNLGWTLVTPSTAGSIPDGYTSTSITFAVNKIVGNVSGSSTSCTGNAATATKFASSQSVALTGDVTGSASSQAGWSVATTLANSGVTAGSYGPSAAASPAHGGTFSVPYITVDAKGRVTSASTKTITLPSDNNTDTKVTNTLATTTKAYVTGTTSATTSTGTQVFDTGVYLDTTAGQLTATTFKGALSGNASTATKFASSQSVALTGDVTGSASSQAGWSVATTLANSGVTAGSYGPSANASPAHSGTFSVPYITVDAKGRVTSASTKTITLPSDNNTDTKVTNTLATTTKAYVTGTTSATTSTGTQVFDTGVYLDTTAGKLVATTFEGSGASLTSLNASNISSGTLAAARLATSGVTASSYGPSANASPNHSGTFSVPYITVDKYGRITAASTKTITLPSDNNTDTKVTNTLGTTTKFYLTGTTSSSTNTGTQYFDTGIYSTTTAGQLQVTNSIITPKITFPSNSNDTDDYCYITSEKSSTKTSMDFYVGNDIADGTASSTTEDKFVFHLPDMGDYQLQSNLVKIYNEIFIGAYGVVEAAEFRGEYISCTGTISLAGTGPSTIKRLNPGSSSASTSFLVGDSQYRYYDVYCTRGAFNGSDSKLKENIKPISRNGIVNNGVQILSSIEDEENVSSMVTSYDLYNYVKDAGIYSYKYKIATLDLEDDEEQTNADSEYYIGILADEIPDDVFNVIGVYSKTEEEYANEVDKRPELLERYNTLVENGYYDEDKNLNKLDRISGMTLTELREKALNEPEEPVRLINAPAQVSMLQEVLSIALNKIEALEAEIEELKSK